MTNVDPATRASALFLHKGAVSLEVCAAAESNVIMNLGGATRSMELLRNHFAPDRPCDRWTLPATHG